MDVYRVFVCIFFCFVVIAAKEPVKPTELNEDNWKQLLEGEWLVKFHAPWCPSCKAMRGTWERVAHWGDESGFKVAKVDVTDNPGLSGRFLITALPSFYHVKEGVFRQYTGAREESDFITFVEDKKYESVDTISWWREPTSIQMGGLGYFFKASMHIRGVHESMTEVYGIPVWGSYVIFAIITIIIGLLFGLVIVFLCDALFPLPPPPTFMKEPDEQEQDVIEDDSPTEKRDDSPTALRKRPKASTE